MKQLKKIALALGMMILSITSFGCSSTNAEQKSNENNSATMAITSTKSSVDVQAELNKAKANGKAVLVVVTGNGASQTDQALKVANDAKSIYKNAVVIELNRDDVANAKYVNEWQLAQAPLPLIIVVSPSGMATGGLLLNQATAENLVSLIPSPKLDAVYQSLGAGKPALVVFTSKSLSDRNEVLKICKEANAKLNNNATLIEVDINDSKEQGFMEQMRVYSDIESSITVVINTAGQVSGRSVTLPDATKLAEAATNILRGGCGSQFGPSSCGQD